MTRKEIQDRVVATAGLQDTEPLDETALVQAWIYQGTLDLLSRTRCVARCLQLGVTAGEDTYTLAHGVMSIIDVRDGQSRRLRRDDEDGPGFVLIRSDLLQFVPAPTEDEQVQVWAVPRPVPMQNDTDDLGDDPFGSIPDEYQDAVELYANWHASDYAHEANSQRGERYRVLYEGQDGRGGRLAMIRALVNKRGTAMPPRRRVVVRVGRTPRAAWVD